MSRELDLRSTLGRLARERPVFHSEADLQHALAWQIHLEDPRAQVRLEKPVELNGKRCRIDLIVTSGKHETGIEIKYKTRRLDLLLDGECFLLRAQSAQDSGRYDVVRDFQRLEQYAAAAPQRGGWVVFITNDPSYWAEVPTSAAEPAATAADWAFRIGEGRRLCGIMQWRDTASPGTRKGRENALALQGSYECRWRPYARIAGEIAGEFRMLCCRVPASS